MAIDIPNLDPNTNYAGQLAVKSINEFSYAKGTAVRITFGNRTGVIEYVVWSTTLPRDDRGSTIEVGEIYYVEFATSEYRGVTNISRVTLLEKLAPTNYDLSDFAPSSYRSIEGLRTGVSLVLDGMDDKEIETLSRQMLKEVGDEFFRAPAAIKMHSAYIGGLAEHALNLCNIATGLIPIYRGFFPEIDEDAVLFGCLFHDIGKCTEYAVKTAAVEPTLEGELVNHIVYGPALVERLAVESGMPKEKMRRLQHILASHHGQLDYGSPVPPKTVEAMFVHLLDMMDSKMMHVHKMIADATGDGDFTGYSIDTKARFLKTTLGNLPR